MFLPGKGSELPKGIFPQLETSKPVLRKLKTSLVEDLYDELELIAFPVSSTMVELANLLTVAIPWHPIFPEWEARP